MMKFGICVLAAVCFLLAPLSAVAQPAISDVSPRGLRLGATTTLTISGSGLGANAKLISSFPIAGQQILEGATPQQIKIAVTLPAGALPGIYAFRLVDSAGISDAVMLGVDRLAQSPFVERVEATPIALSGVIAGEQKLATVFRGAAGEEFSIDLESRRLGGAMKPVVRLLDAAGKQIAYSSGREALEGDARLTATLPADGEYRVEFHDSLFRAPASPFRLKIGRLAFADTVFPAVLNADSDAELEFFALGKSWGLKAPYHAGAVHPLVAASWRPEFLTGVTAAPGVGKIRQFVEPGVHDPAAPVDAGAAPVGVSGKLAAAQEIDRYLVSVTAGQKHRVSMQGARLRSPIDGQIIIRNEQGAEMARGDDQPGSTDPAVEFDVPAGVAKVIVEVRDTQGGGGEGFVYHVSAVSLATPEVSFAADVDRVAVPRGGVALLPVRVNRRNFAGAVNFSLSAPVNGVQVAAADAPADAEIALVAFTAAADANGAGVTHVSGKSAVPETPIASDVSRAGNLGTAVEFQPGLRRDFAVAATDASPIAVTWQAATVDLLGDTKLVRCTLKLDRAAGLAGKTRVRLVTSQVQPKKTIKENNQDKQVDDVESTLRLEGETVFAQDAGMATVTLRVPANLPARAWQLAFVAEVLSADDKAVVASAPSLPRTMKFSN